MAAGHRSRARRLPRCAPGSRPAPRSWHSDPPPRPEWWSGRALPRQADRLTRGELVAARPCRVGADAVARESASLQARVMRPAAQLLSPRRRCARLKRPDSRAACARPPQRSRRARTTAHPSAHACAGGPRHSSQPAGACESLCQGITADSGSQTLAQSARHPELPRERCDCLALPDNWVKVGFGPARLLGIGSSVMQRQGTLTLHHSYKERCNAMLGGHAIREYATRRETQFDGRRATAMTRRLRDKW